MTPPYKFIKTGSESKLEIQKNNLNSEYRILKLYNLIIKPFEERHNLNLEIKIGDKEHKFDLSKLVHDYNSDTNLMAHFSDREAPNNFKPIPLPEGTNQITYNIVPSDNAKNFEVILS